MEAVPMKRVPSFLAGSLAVLTLAGCADVTRPPAGDSSGEDVSISPDANRSGGSSSSLEHTRCEGTLAGTFENVIVPPGGFCFLVNAIVHHNVVALEDAVLAVFDSQIGDNVFGVGADVVNTGRISVGGNIHVRNGGPHPIFVEVSICGADVTGNVVVEEMIGTVRVDPDQCGSPNTVREGNVRITDNEIPSGEILSLTSNSIVLGHARVVDNEGPGTKSVQFNTIGGTLTCEDNEAPFVGGPNVASRTRGQCF
jgi:hypothetical protein